MCRALRQPHPDGVSRTDRQVTDCGHRIAVREYRAGTGNRPDRPVVLYFHGGGFILGGLESHDDICAEICASTGLTVVSVDYRLAPEHRHPAPFEDAVCAFRWADRHFDAPLLVVGESAGGNIAACLCHAMKGAKRPAIGQLLIYPAMSVPWIGESHKRHAHAPLLSYDDVRAYDAIRADGTPCYDDPSFSPLAADDFSGLPPTVVFTAEYDPLASEGEAYCRAIGDAGGTALLLVGEALPHGYARARGLSSRARRAFDRIVGETARLASGAASSSSD
jgi:acetyl esterase